MRRVHRYPELAPEGCRTAPCPPAGRADQVTGHRAEPRRRPRRLPHGPSRPAGSGDQPRSRDGPMPGGSRTGLAAGVCPSARARPRRAGTSRPRRCPRCCPRRAEITAEVLAGVPHRPKRPSSCPYGEQILADHAESSEARPATSMERSHAGRPKSAAEVRALVNRGAERGSGGGRQAAHGRPAHLDAHALRARVDLDVVGEAGDDRKA